MPVNCRLAYGLHFVYLMSDLQNVLSNSSITSGSDGRFSLGGMCTDDVESESGAQCTTSSVTAAEVNIFIRTSQKQ